MLCFDCGHFEEVRRDGGDVRCNEFQRRPGSSEERGGGIGFCRATRTAPRGRTSAHFLNSDDRDNDSLPKVVTSSGTLTQTWKYWSDDRIFGDSLAQQRHERVHGRCRNHCGLAQGRAENWRTCHGCGLGACTPRATPKCF